MINCFKKIELTDWEDLSNGVDNYIQTTDILQKKYSWNTIDSAEILDKIPMLETIFSVYNLKVKTVAIIFRSPLSRGGIHIDSGVGIRALIPIRNYQGSYTKFFDVDKSKIQIKTGAAGDRYYDIPKSAIIAEIASVETITPIVFDPQVPHGVWTNPNLYGPRLTLTIGFNRSPRELLS
jgi:hypothetical protein